MRKQFSIFNFQFSKRGFTLLEILVAVGIIVTLVSIGTSSYSTAQRKSRDAKRKSDLKQIQKAFELYKQDQSVPAYPATLPSAGTSWTNPTSGTLYMNKFPGDPFRTPADYYYSRPKSGSTSNLTYDLCTCLESLDDPEGTTGNCSAAYTCSSGTGKKYLLNEP